MRIGLLSDTHSHIDDRMIKYLSECDEIWHAGDVGNVEVIDRLRKIKPVRGVYGNIDGKEVRREFPEHLRFTVEGVTVWITHIGGRPGKYWPPHIRTEMYRSPPKLFICGHSHILRVEMDKRTKCLYMNPGAAGKYGHHKVRTMLRFRIAMGGIKDLEVVELETR